MCQILSPDVLRNLARPTDKCRQVARDLWKNLFHKLFWMIRDFSDVFQQKLDLGQYNSLNDEENIQRCKVGTMFKNFYMWIHLRKCFSVLNFYKIVFYFYVEEHCIHMKKKKIKRPRQDSNLQSSAP